MVENDVGQIRLVLAILLDQLVEILRAIGAQIELLGRVGNPIGARAVVVEQLLLEVLPRARRTGLGKLVQRVQNAAAILDQRESQVVVAELDVVERHVFGTVDGLLLLEDVCERVFQLSSPSCTHAHTNTLLELRTYSQLADGRYVLRLKKFCSDSLAKLMQNCSK